MAEWVPPQKVRLAYWAQFLDGNGYSNARWVQSVVAASTANGTLATAYNDGDTLDGVLLHTGDRILLKAQTSGADNGIYVVNGSSAPTRSLDLPVGNDAIGYMVLVNNGTANGGRVFRCNGAVPQVVGTGVLTWSEFSPTRVAGDIVYADGASTGLTTVATGLDEALSGVFIGDAVGVEIDRWYNEGSVITSRGFTMANVNYGGSGGPRGHSYLDPSGDNATYITYSGLTTGHRIRVEAFTNGAGAVGGSGGGTYLRLTVNAGNTDLLSDQTGWVRRSGIVTIGASGNLDIKGVFSPSFGDLVVTDLDGVVSGPLAVGGIARIVAAAAIANTETVVAGTSLPPGAMGVGTTFRIRAYGRLTSGAVPGSSIFRCRIGTTTLTGNIAATLTLVNGTLVTDQPFVVEMLVTVRTSGASGTVIGNVEVSGGVVGAFTVAGGISALAATVAVDTTATKRVEFTYISGNAGTTATFEDAVIEVVYP